MKPIAFAILFLVALPCFSQLELTYYLPSGNYLPEIPEPGSLLGHEVGERHITHDQLTGYLKELAERSDRVIYQEYARSYEGRPLFHLIITSPENQEKLERLRMDHLSLSDPDQSASLDLAEMPVVVRLGYGVHGNESSASNASLLVAYYLAASSSKTVMKYLDSMVILLDPCLNPDGFNRHASWVNMHQSMVPMSDENSRGFHESWPGGRTNHYWFDLNRDWILLQHPETRGRVKVFHEWKPNVQTDHHEMGASSSFFFQPGVPTRNNPLTPPGATELTQKIARFHASALDGIGTLYYSGESFDDFYYGKGSSYPDVNGSVGILFEQAGTRGLERETPRGMLTFPYAIRNHFTVSLSTLEASLELRHELLEYQRDFYQKTPGLFESSEVKGFIFGGNGDVSSVNQLLNVLMLHRIRVHSVREQVTLNGVNFAPSGSYIIAMNQPQIRLIKSLFEPMHVFTDSLFYDISAWTFPDAFNIPCEELRSVKILEEAAGDPVTEIPWRSGMLYADSGAIGYLLPWNDYQAPRALYAIQAAGVITQVAGKPISPRNEQIHQTLGPGTIFIPIEKQPLTRGEVESVLRNAAEETGIDIYCLSTSYNTRGMDMGSQGLLPLSEPSILLLTGEGVSSSEAGEIWHLLDTRMKVPVVLTELSLLNRMDLSGYSHILMPSGSYGTINDAGKEELDRWIRRGGTVIALRSANRWLAGNGFCDLKFKEEQRDSTTFRPYGDLEPDRGSKYLAGSIFEAEVDLTHPIGYGLYRDRIPIFRNSTMIAEPRYRPYAVPVRYTDDPVLNGYVPDGIGEALSGTPAVTISSLGNGRIISFMDNPNFRGFWYGTNRLFMNALFFGPVISEESTR